MSNEVTAPPLSLVKEDAQGILYSRDVNRIYDAADRGGGRASAGQKTAATSARDETWLATGCGVKCIDHKAGVARLYGRAEGLPGTQVIAIAADDSGVWCLVRDPQPAVIGELETTLHLCVFDAQRGRWQERRALVTSRSNNTTTGRPSEGRSLIALNARYVAVVTSFIRNDQAAFALLYDRKTGQIVELPWEPGLSADASVVLPTTLCLDDRGMWVGTDHGVLRWDFATMSWRRILPDRVIDYGSAIHREGQDYFWVVDHARKRYGDEDWYSNKPQLWNLTRISAEEGDVKSWSPPPLVVAPTWSNPDLSPNFPGQDKAVDLEQSPPTGVFAADDGAIWATHRVVRADFSQSMLPVGAGWTRFDPGSATWAAYAIHSTANNPFRFEPSPLEIDSNQGVNRQTPFATIPSGAVRPLALWASRPLPVDFQSGVSGDPELFWIHRRFPEWLGTDASADAGLVASAKQQALLPPHLPAWQKSRGPLPDPAHPDKVWLVDISSDALVHCAPEDIPAPVLQGRRQGFSTNVRSLSKGAPGRVDVFPLPGAPGGTVPLPPLQIRPDVTALIPLNGAANAHAPAVGEPNVLIATSEGFFCLNTRTETASAAHILGRFSSNARGIVADAEQGSSSLLYIANEYGRNSLIRWKPGEETFSLLSDAGITSGVQDIVAVNSADGGIWLRMQNEANGALYLPGAVRKGTSDAGAISVSAPTDGPSSWRLAGATGTIAWWASNYSNDNAFEVRGYDVARKRWLAPLPTKVFDAVAMNFVRLDSQDNLFLAAADKREGGDAVWRYEAVGDRWIPIAPVPPQTLAALAEPVFAIPTYPPSAILRPQLLSVTAGAILMVGYEGKLYRYDRAAAHWEPPVALPESFLPSQRPYSLSERLAVAIEDAVYVGGRSGLYRLRLSGGAEQRLPTSPEWVSIPVYVSGKGADGLAQRSSSLEPLLIITSILPERRYVYALLSGGFGARFDSATGQWSVYDETRGFPVTASNSQLYGDGGEGAWLVNTDTIYRYDAGTDRWQQQFGPSDKTALVSRVSPTPPIPGPLPRFIYNVAICGNEGETDVLATTPTKLDDRRSENSLAIWRFANADGHLLGTITDPEKSYVFQGALLAAKDGHNSLWAATSRGLYFVRPNAAKAEQWHLVTLPPDVPFGQYEELSPGADGGLWIMNSDSAYLWKRPHE